MSYLEAARKAYDHIKTERSGRPCSPPSETTESLDEYEKNEKNEKSQESRENQGVLQTSAYEKSLPDSTLDSSGEYEKNEKSLNSASNVSLSPGELLADLLDRGFSLTAEPPTLFVSPASRLTYADRAAIGAHKAALLELLASKQDYRLVNVVADDKVAAPVFLDLETRSRVPISIGGRRYAADRSTEILSAVASLDGRILIWTPGRPTPTLSWPEGFGEERPIDADAGADLPLPLARAIAAGRPLVAHNAMNFEQHVWRAKGLPAPSRWIDTMPWARAAGCPGGLDAAASWLLGKCKDDSGKGLIGRYCKPYGKDKKFRDFTGSDWPALVRYNLVDVLLLGELYSVLRQYDQEPELIAVDQQINNRGVFLDRQLAQAVLDLAAAETARLAAEAESATGGAVKASDLNRKDYLVEWLRHQGVKLNGRTASGKVRLTKGDADDLLDNEELPDDVRAVLIARRAVARTTVAKLLGALQNVDDDGRLRDQFVYHAAHTGRWVSHGVQVQNLVKPRPGVDVGALLAAAGDAERFRAALAPGVSFADGLSGLIRPCFRAAPGHVLLIADFAAIEACGLAWCAGEHSLLERFSCGEDVYCDFASLLFGRSITKADKLERDVGKVTILGCGYQMSAERFAMHARTACLDLAAVGLTPEAVVAAYRDAYPAICGSPRLDGFGRAGGLWKDVERAAVVAVRDGHCIQAGRCAFAREGDRLVITLPSGRRLHYRQARVELRTPATAADRSRHSSTIPPKRKTNREKASRGVKAVTGRKKPPTAAKSRRTSFPASAAIFWPTP
jgi:DNA polymerase